MIRLYPFQEKLIADVRQKMSEGHKNIVVQSPTGSGKTVIFSYIVSEMKKRGKRALIITNRIELLSETGGTLEQFDLHPFEILAGQISEPPPNRQVYIAMSQTLRRRITKWKRFFRLFDVVIYDEVHLQEFNAYSGLFGCIVLGFTATPVRFGRQRQLSEDFTALVEGPQVPELIRDGYLMPDKYYGVERVDMNGVRISSLGDYQESDMYERFNRPKLYTGVVDNWKKIAAGTQTLVFCVNIMHTVKTCNAFNDAGIKAKFLTSDMAAPIPGKTESDRVKYEKKMSEYRLYNDLWAIYSGDRHDILRQWKNREFDVLVNAGILTTGFNAPGIETIIMNRATISVPLWLQIMGRGSRVFKGKTHFNVLDFGDNASRLGYYNQQREWSLIHDSRSSAGAPPVKECKGQADSNGKTGCNAYIYASQMICPFCGYQFSEKKDEILTELKEINYISATFSEPDWKRWEREAEQKGYKHGWVISRVIASGGRDALIAYARAKGYKNGWLWNVEKRFEKQLRITQN